MSEVSLEERTVQICVYASRLACTPRVFTKLVKVPYSKLRDQGFESIGHMDDSCLQGEDFYECSQNAQATRKLFADLGFIIHPIKSVLTPVQILGFLGFVLNSIKMSVSLTPDKAHRIASACAELLKTARPVIRDVAQVVGSLVAVFPGVKYGPLLCRQIELDQAMTLKANRWTFDANMQLSQRAKDDLLWWVNNVEHSCKPVSVGNPDLTIKADASTLGWGGVLDSTRDSTRSGGRWSEVEAQCHIHYLELLAAFFAPQSFCSDVQNMHVTVDGQHDSSGPHQ